MKCLSSLMSCAVGLGTDYSVGTVPINLNTEANKFIIQVLDNRPYIVKCSDSATFTGLSRSLYGIHILCTPSLVHL